MLEWPEFFCKHVVFIVQYKVAENQNVKSKDVLRVEDAMSRRQQVVRLDQRRRAEGLSNGEKLWYVDVQESHPRELIGPCRQAALNPVDAVSHTETASLF